MNCGIRIKEIAVYHPSTKLNVEHYIKHFAERGKDVEHLLRNVYGKENRYIIDNQGKSSEERENSLTMQIQAAKDVLQKCNLTGKDIDGILVATQFPEYLGPPSFMWVHKAIDGKSDCFGYDLNGNCVGMVLAFEQAAKFIAQDDKVNRILVVGGDFMTVGISKEDENCYGVFGDSACAIIVERTENGDESCLVDSNHFMNNQPINYIRFPVCGLSEMLENQNPNIFSYQMEQPTADIPVILETIQKMLERNGLTIDDINGFCFSQSVKAQYNKITEALQIPHEKCPYVGDVYGYTGANSPFLALNELMSKNQIQRGDYVLFWTFGAAMQHIFMLIRY